MATALDRSDLLAGLRDLVALLHEAREEAGIRLVGGAALALRHFDRATMQNLDSLHIRPGSDADDIRQLLSLRGRDTRRRRGAVRGVLPG